MNSTEFLTLRKLQKERGATDYEMAQFLDAVNAGDSTFEAVFEMAMIEVADESYRPEGEPVMTWCRNCIGRDDGKGGGQGTDGTPL